MCNIHFDEQAVRRALGKRAKHDKTPLPVVSPNQIFRDLYHGQPVGGVKLYFVEKVKAAMLGEALRTAFADSAKSEHRGFHEISPRRAVACLFGVRDFDRIPLEWSDQRFEAEQLARRVQYDMMIEESQALRAESGE